MLNAASRAVFLPMFGFMESLNVSVAAALVMQRLLDLCPEARGDLGVSERAVLRSRWYDQLARNANQRRVFKARAARLNQQEQLGVVAGAATSTATATMALAVTPPPTARADVT